MAEASNESWEKYLWRCGLVALDPLAENVCSLQLLDIVAKNGTEGFLSGRPTLRNLGSVCSLRSSNDVHPDWADTKQKIEESLKELEGVNKKDNELFRKDYQLEGYACNSTSGCGILASIVSLFRAGVDTSSYKKISVSEVVFEVVQRGVFDDFFEGQGRGTTKTAVWEPDVAKIRRDTRGPHDNEKVELWLVVEIKRGKVINLSGSSSVDASAIASVPASAIASVPASGGMTVRRSNTGDLAATADSPIIPFAFKAIRLTYGNDGKLIKKEAGMGKRRPKKRADEPSEFDVDKYPETHMGGLFYRASELGGISSEGGEVHENDFECLRFVGVEG